MKKLNKRQIIILAVAALAALWAVYELFVAGPMAKKAKLQDKPVTIASFVNAVSEELTRNRIAGVNAAIARSAEREWEKNPFWDRASYREFAGNETGFGSAAKIVYSGYVDTGRKQMAIINGWEYEAGEELDMEGYVLKSVTPSRVVITNRNTGGELYVPIQD